MKPHNHVVFKDLQKYFLITVTLLLLTAFLFFISPFFSILIIAGVIAVDIFPLNDWLAKKIRIRSLASILTLLIVVLVILAPFALFVTFITGEAVDAYQAFSVNTDFSLGEDIKLLPERFKDSKISDWVETATEYVPLSSDGIFVIVQDSLQKISAVLVAQTTNIFKQISLFLLYLITFFVSLYYFLFDGHKLVARIKKLLPVPTKYKDELFNRLNILSKGIIYGIFGAAIVQGFLAGLGFYIAGIGNAAFWGTMMALFSPVPYIGTAIIWIPAGIYLIITGHWIAGSFVLAWGTLIVGMADNFVKPYLIGKSAAINSLAVLLTIIGGVLVFGLDGLVFGPFLLTLLFSFLHIYELEYKAVLEE